MLVSSHTHDESPYLLGLGLDPLIERHMHEETSVKDLQTFVAKGFRWAISDDVTEDLQMCVRTATARQSSALRQGPGRIVEQFAREVAACFDQGSPSMSQHRSPFRTRAMTFQELDHEMGPSRLQRR